MTRANSQASPKIDSTINHNRRITMFFAALGALAIGVGCSSSKPQAKASQSSGITLRPAVLNVSAPAVRTMPVAETIKSASPVEKPKSKLISYRSRDYGVSFSYPWQYSILSAKSLADADESLLPKSDGSDEQFTLARIDIPKGFYPGTDFDSGYFTVSLNQELDEQQCEASVKTDDVKTQNINGVDFRWMETDEAGSGSSLKVRNYAAFANGTCYEMELGVKTKNDHGLAREVDLDQVFARLNSILDTVKIQPNVNKSLQPETADAVLPAAQK